MVYQNRIDKNKQHIYISVKPCGKDLLSNFQGEVSGTELERLRLWNNVDLRDLSTRGNSNKNTKRSSEE